MAPKDLHSTGLPQTEQTNNSGYTLIHKRGFRIMEKFMETHGLRPWNNENIEKAHQIIDNIRSRDTQTSAGGFSLNHDEISDYAMMREQGFSGMKEFMESHGLKLGNDEDVQTAHQIIDKMREFDEEHSNLPSFAEQSDNAHGQIIEYETMRVSEKHRQTITYEDFDGDNERTVMGGTSLAARQEEVSLDVGDHIPDGLEGDGIGGSDWYPQDIEEGLNVPDLQDESGYNGEDFYDEYEGYDEVEDDGTPTGRLSDSAWLKNGGWKSMDHFMLSYNLRIYDEKDYEEGKRIIAAFRAHEDEEKEANTNQSTGIQNTSQKTQTSGATGRDGGDHTGSGSAKGGNNTSVGSSDTQNKTNYNNGGVEFMGTLQVLCLTLKRRLLLSDSWNRHTNLMAMVDRRKNEDGIT
ncbi:hypothetical protein NHQ30_009441 [Ciborinia camelliae]|nr:hypothetical protein NHQ30_009441 [Ciborinia camelliae]